MKLKLRYLLLILFSILSCKKSITDSDKQNTLLKGSVWSLYSTQKKKYVSGSNTILLDTTIINDCSMKSRLKFKDSGIAEYDDNCIYAKQISGTWGITADGYIYATLDVALSTATGLDKMSFGFPKSEILSLDENQFKRKHYEYYSFTDSNGRIDYTTEVTTTYKKTN
jgi:hypothetical protein